MKLKGSSPKLFYSTFQFIYYHNKDGDTSFFGVILLKFELFFIGIHTFRLKSMEVFRKFLYTVLFFLGVIPFLQANTIDSLLVILKKNPSDSIKADTYRQLAMSYYFDQGDLDTGIIFIEKALQTVPKKYIHLHSKIYSNYGLLLREKGIYDKALSQYLNARKLAEKSKDTSLITNAVMGIAVVHTIQKDYPVAEKYYQEYFRLCDESGNELAKASYFNNMGLLYFHQKKYQKALEFYTNTMEIYKKFEDQRGFATTNENIGLLYADNLNDPEKAIDNFRNSLSIWRSLEDNHSEAITMGYMAFALIKKGAYKNAIDTCQVALNIAHEAGAISTERDLFDYLYRAYDKMGDHSQALKYYKKYIQYRDSLVNDQKTQEITEMRVRFEESNRHAADSIKMAVANQLELEKKDEVIQKDKYFKFAMAGGLVLFFVLGVVIYLAYRNKQKSNKEIAEQKRHLEERNREITDSIQYAKHIQDSFLPDENSLSGNGVEGFVFYRPKDIVAGDFYWKEEIQVQQQKLILFAAADCTGHGVPGALVSVTCYHAINQAIKQHQLHQPDQILNKVNDLVNESFSRSGKNVNDGMDIAFCSYNVATGELNFAGANNSLYLVKDGNLEEIKADKKPIGKYFLSNSFENNKIRPEKGSMLYLFSDGFAHQFGGPGGKKYKYNRFREFLISIADFPLKKQKELLEGEFDRWCSSPGLKGEKQFFEQLDDVCVLGFRIL